MISAGVWAWIPSPRVLFWDGSWRLEKKGLLNTSLSFGSPEGVTEAISDMANGKDFGQEMARGTRWLSEKYGGREFAIQIKGLEMAAYDPRGSWDRD